MNFIDIILIIPIIWFIYKGFKKGFIIEIASLIALFLGIYVAIHFSGNITSFIDDNSVEVKTHYGSFKAWLPICKKI